VRPASSFLGVDEAIASGERRGTDALLSFRSRQGQRFLRLTAASPDG
jgi:hypothetical protein